MLRVRGRVIEQDGAFGAAGQRLRRSGTMPSAQRLRRSGPAPSAQWARAFGAENQLLTEVSYSTQLSATGVLPLRM